MRLLFTLLLLGACGSVNLATIAQLSRLDPLTAEPAGFVAAIVLPLELDLPEGGAMLGFAWRSSNEVIGGDFPLRRHVSFEGSGIATSAEQHVVFFTLSAEHAAQIRLVQRAISARKAQGVEGEGSLSIFASPCARDGLAAPVISTFLRLEEGGRFLPLLRNFDMREEISDGQRAELAACD